ncbi:MAG TPA: hypothetical protein VLT79_07520 [Gemmatimonadales bacterium]|nr:hypothetical protein [Gemmatimonadales bacterium]
MPSALGGGRTLRAHGAAALLLVVLACLRDAPTGTGTAGTVVVRASVSGSGVATVVVRVAAVDIPAPLVFNLPVQNGVASGSLTLPSGSQRTIVLLAYDAGGVKTDSGSVTVNIQPGTNPLLSVILTALVGDVPVHLSLGDPAIRVAPSLLYLKPGDTATVAATVFDAAGMPLSDSVHWATTTAREVSVVQTGPRTALVTALVPGATQVVANDKGAAGATSVVVMNSPAGWAVISQYDMHAIDDGGWFNVYPGAIDSGSISVVTDTIAPRSAPYIWQYLFPVGFTGGQAPATEYTAFAPARDVYFAFWWKVSNPWQGHSSGVNKVVEVLDDATPFGSYFYKMFGPPSGPFHTQVTFETDWPAANFPENIDTTAITLGVWHFSELLVKRSDASVRWWLDGKLKGAYSGAHYGGTRFNQAEIYPGWGGTGDTKSETDFMWFDDARILAQP